MVNSANIGNSENAENSQKIFPENSGKISAFFLYKYCFTEGKRNFFLV